VLYLVLRHKRYQYKEVKGFAKTRGQHIYKVRGLSAQEARGEALKKKRGRAIKIGKRQQALLYKRLKHYQMQEDNNIY
jgi:hypothetical protein